MLSMNDVIFREYDIRGIVGQELYIENVYELACSFAYYFLAHTMTTQSVVVGMDVRTHSPEIRDALCLGLLDNGLDVICIGMCTSPMVYYATHVLPVGAGLMVTASHNPKEYNGIKICLGAEMVHGKELQVIKQLYKERKKLPKASRRGVLISHDIKSSYIEMLRQEFAHLIGMPLPIVFDCANGTAGIVIPDLIKVMQWSHARVLYAEPDGMFPHHSADPIIEENMRDLCTAVQADGAVVGIGFDGDADRMGAVTEKGMLLSGDKLLALFAKHILIDNPQLTVVYDINASGALRELLLQWGITPIMAPCGHANIKKYMRAEKALLGGEISCHFFFEDRNGSYDDGIYAALRLLEIVYTTGMTLTDCLKDFPIKMSSPNYRLPCLERDKQRLIDAVHASFRKNSDLKLMTIDGVHVTTPFGWGLIRASNTQAAICFKFEADTKEGLRSLQQLFADALSSVYEHDLYATFGIQDVKWAG
jgi:phosphomannomutase/phosphoglucomutase